MKREESSYSDDEAVLINRIMGNKMLLKSI